MLWKLFYKHLAFPAFAVGLSVRGPWLWPGPFLLYWEPLPSCTFAAPGNPFF